MGSKMEGARSRARQFGLAGMSLLLIVVLTVVASGCRAAEDQAQNPTFVDFVEVEERNDNFYAIVTGNLPDACSEVGDISQEVKRDTIYLDIFSSKAEDMVCAQALAPFEEEVLLDTGDLDAGEYTVVVNQDQATASFAIP